MVKRSQRFERGQGGAEAAQHAAKEVQSLVVMQTSWMENLRLPEEVDLPRVQHSLEKVPHGVKEIQQLSSEVEARRMLEDLKLGTEDVEPGLEELQPEENKLQLVVENVQSSVGDSETGMEEVLSRVPNGLAEGRDVQSAAEGCFSKVKYPTLENDVEVQKIYPSHDEVKSFETVGQPTAENIQSTDWPTQHLGNAVQHKVQTVRHEGKKGAKDKVSKAKSKSEQAQQAKKGQESLQLFQPVKEAAAIRPAKQPLKARQNPHFELQVLTRGIGAFFNHNTQCWLAFCVRKFVM